MTDKALQQRLDRNYRYQRHFYDLTRAYYLLGRNTLIAGLVPTDGGSVLEIGCGTARNLVQSAKLSPGADHFGIDLSHVMLETARRKLARQSLDDCIRLAHGNAASFEPQALFGRRSFDRIFFAYALSMIPPWQSALAHAADHLSPGGSMHIVDFGLGSGLPGRARVALRAWLARFQVTPRDDLEPVLRAIAMQRNAELFITPLYRTYATYAVLTRR